MREGDLFLVFKINFIRLPAPPCWSPLVSPMNPFGTKFAHQRCYSTPRRWTWSSIFSISFHLPLLRQWEFQVGQFYKRRSILRSPFLLFWLSINKEPLWSGEPQYFFCSLPERYAVTSSYFLIVKFFKIIFLLHF